MVFAAPIVFTSLRSHGLTGYYQFEGITCACGHTAFPRITADEYCWYIPAHRSTDLSYRLQQLVGSEWVATRKGTNSFRLRLTGGEVYRTYAGNTNWFHEERIYNLWRVWIPRLIGE